MRKLLESPLASLFALFLLVVVLPVGCIAIGKAVNKAETEAALVEKYGVPMPKRTYTPEAMKNQCDVQPGLPYCVSLCKTDKLLKPKWCS